jgi:hypothetical protein
MRALFLIVFGLGCVPKSQPCSPPDPSADLDDSIFSVTSPDGAQILLQFDPATQPPVSGPSPTVVFVQGGWKFKALPFSPTHPRLNPDLGFHTLYLQLPNDARGAQSRAALATALLYAAGMLDEGGDACQDDATEAQPIVIAAYSNGGNLAWSTLADPALLLPPIAGIATFETPPSSQFATLDMGTRAQQNDRFQDERCTVTSAEIVCAMDYTPIIAADGSRCTQTETCLGIDGNNDGILQQEEFALHTILDPSSGLQVPSIQVAAAAHIARVLPQDFMSNAQTADFWAQRMGPDVLKWAAERFPGLAAIVTGTEKDHALTALKRPIHLTTFAMALQQAGVAWVRLHPDAAYMQMLQGDVAIWEDNGANDDTNLNDPSLSAEPEESGDLYPTAYLNSAVLELLDRSRVLDWSNDLDDPLEMIP